MRLSAGSSASRAVSFLLSLSMVVSQLTFAPAVAVAADPPAVASPQAVPAAVPATPTVVATLPDATTPYSKSEALSDGSVRTAVHTGPMRFPDATGALRTPDASLIPGDEPGDLVTARTPLLERFGVESAGLAPVRVGGPDWSVGIDLLGSSQSGRIALSDRVLYPSAGTDASLLYEVAPDAVKETVVLESPAAASSYTFALDFEGVTLANAPGLGYVLLREGTGEPVASLRELLVTDASGAVCEDAETRVECVPGGAYVTYAVPRSWLADPKRTFPVLVDPTVVLWAGSAFACYDTHVAASNPTQSYGSATELDVGASGGQREAYLVFDLASVPPSATITSATLKLYQTAWQSANGTPTPVMDVGKVTSAWSTSSTWSTRPSHTRIGSVSSSATATYVSLDCSATVRAWHDRTVQNLGFSLYQTDGATYRRFASGDNATLTNRPRLEIVYTLARPGGSGTVSAETTGLAWFMEREGSGDDEPGEGRGRVSLSWASAPRAEGYRIELHDGSAFRPVGRTRDIAATSWTSEAVGAYPPDSSVATVPAGTDPFAPARTPSPATIETTLTMPFSQTGAGLVVSDGTYLYVKRLWYNPGPNAWQRVGTGEGGTVAGASYGQVGTDPGTNYALSAFMIGDVLYGRMTSATRVAGLRSDSTTTTNNVVNLDLSVPPLDRYTGLPITSSSINALLTSDAGRVYSVAFSRGTGFRDGFRIRVYDTAGTWLFDRDIATTSFFMNGVLADDTTLSFIEWNALNTARVVKVRTSDFAQVGEWTLDQASTRAASGCYDRVNDCYWLGSLDTAARVRRYSGADLELRDDPRALYAKTSGEAFDTTPEYRFRVVPYNASGDTTSTCATVTVTLPDRTVQTTDPAHIGLSRTESGDEDVELIGAWTTTTDARASGASRIETSGAATATVTFTGSRLDALSAVGPWSGELLVAIDGGEPEYVDQYAPARSARSRFFSTGTLSAGKHTVAFRASGSGNASSCGSVVSLDAFECDGEVTGGDAVYRMEDTDARIDWDGVWSQAATASAGGVDAHAADAPAAVTVAFDGTAIEWVGEKGPGCGVALVSVDDDSPVEVDCSGASTTTSTVLYRVDSLPPGAHVLRIEWTGRTRSASGTRIAVDYFAVDGIPAAAPSSRRFDECDPRVGYDGLPGAVIDAGAWGGTYRSLSATGSLTFDFSGTACSLVSPVGPGLGYARVYVDAAPAQTVDLWAQTSASQRSVFSTSGLTPGDHTVRMEWTGERSALSTGTVIAVDAFECDGLLLAAPPMTRFEETDVRAGASSWTPLIDSGSSGGTLRAVHTTGTEARITFGGTRLSWIARTGPDCGQATVSVDGGSPTTVDLYSPTTSRNRRVFSTGVLDYGTHTARIVCSGTRQSASTGTTVTLDALETDGTLTTPTTVSADITSDTTWTLAGSPYSLDGALLVRSGATLRIEPGVVVRPINYWAQGIQVLDTARLLAEGVGEHRVAFTSKSDDSHGDHDFDGASVPHAGDWGGVTFSGQGASSLRGADVRYAGRDRANTGAIHVETGADVTLDDVAVRTATAQGVTSSGDLTMTACTVSDCDGSGVAASAGTLHMEDSTVSGCDDAGVRVTAALARLGLVGVSSSDNIGRAFQLHQGNTPELADLVAIGNTDGDTVLIGADSTSERSTSETLTLEPCGVPYSLYLRVGSGATLELASGLVVKGYRLDVHGRLLARGGEGSRIVFTSLSDDSHGGVSDSGTSSEVDPYRSILFDGAGVAAGALVHCDVLHAKGDGYAVAFTGGAPELNDLNVEGSAADGVRVLSGSPVVSDVSVTDCADSGVVVSPGASPWLRRLVVSDNGMNGVEFRESDGATLEHSSISGNALSGVSTFDSSTYIAHNTFGPPVDAASWSISVDNGSNPTPVRRVPVIHYNDIRDGVLRTLRTVDARYNHWGPTSTNVKTSQTTFCALSTLETGAAAVRAFEPTCAAPERISLPDRATPAHASLSGVAAHDTGVRLADGALILEHTDITLPGWGPEASLARRYDSSITSATLLAPGWRFSFEERVDTTTVGADVTDASGIVSRHLGDGADYLPPHGCRELLSRNESGWSLQDIDDRSTKTFDASGRLVARTDLHGDSVTFQYDDDAITVTAPNGLSRIVVDLSGGKATGAHMEMCDSSTPQGIEGMRVDYDVSADTLTVTTAPDTSDACATVFTYAASRIASVSVPAFEAPGVPDAVWEVAYTSGRITRIDEPGHDEDAYRRTELIYASPLVTLRTFGTVAGVAHTTIDRTWRLDPLGALAEEVVYSSSTGLPAWRGIERDHENLEVTSIEAAGGVSESLRDTSGRVVALIDAKGRTTTHTRDEAGRIVETVDPRGAGVRFTYDEHDDVTREERDLTAQGAVATTTRTFDSHGRTVTERDPAGALRSFEYDRMGGTVSSLLATLTLDVSGRVAHDVGGRTVYDALGRVIAEYDALGSLVASYTYSPSGRVVGTSDATGVAPWVDEAISGYQADLSDLSLPEFAGCASWPVTDPSGIVDTAAERNAIRELVSAAVGPGGYQFGSLGDSYLSRMGGHPSGIPLWYRFGEGFPTNQWVVRCASHGQALVLETGTVYVRVGWEYVPATQTYRRTGSGVIEAAGFSQATLDTLLAHRHMPPAGEPGAITHTSFDVMGHAVGTYRSAGSLRSDITSTVLDPWGRTLETISYSDTGTAISRVRQVLDASGRTVASVDSVAGTTTILLDRDGNALATFGPTSQQTTEAASQQVMDEYGRASSSVEPGADASCATTTTLDYADEEVSTALPDGSTTSVTKDAAGAELSQTESAGDVVITTTYSYDLAGRQLTSKVSGEPTVTTVYDALDRIVSQAAAGAPASTVRYNEAGQTLVATDSAGIATKSVYDLAGRVLTSTVVAPGEAPRHTTTAYDAAGRPVLTENPDGSTVSLEHDAFSRVTSEESVDASGVVTLRTWAFDALSREVLSASKDTTTTTEYGTATTRETTVTVLTPSTRTVRVTNGAGEQVSETCSSLTATDTVTRTVTQRDIARRPTTVVLDTGVATLTCETSYDRVGRVTSQTGPGTYGEGTELTWSARGSRLATRTTHLTLGSVSTSRTVEWSYDTHGRLAREQVSVNGTPTRDTAVTISPAGDVTVLGGRTLAYTGGLLASVSEGGATTAYTHDGAGRRTGAASDEATTTYSWDASGRLVGVRMDREGSNDTTATYGYAADGSRARSVTREGTRTTEVTYRYEGLSLMSLTATDDAGVWGIDLVYEDDRPTSGFYRNGGTVTRFLITTSERGDVIALTDAAGESFATYAYTAYGEIEEFETAGTALVDADTARDIATRQPLRYAGYVWDAPTGLYQCSARYLDPHTCSFISPDPIRADGEMSPYRYCGGDPVNHVDPSGYAWVGKSVPKVRQPYPTWCWVAAIQCAMRFRFPKSNVTAWRIFRYVFPYGDYNQTARPVDILRGLRKFVDDNATSRSWLPAATLRDVYLRGGRPPIVQIKWPDGRGHTVVPGRMMDGDAGSGALVEVMDPVLGDYNYVTHNNLRYSYDDVPKDNFVVKGKWVLTYRY